MKVICPMSGGKLLGVRGTGGERTPSPEPGGVNVNQEMNDELRERMGDCVPVSAYLPAGKREALNKLVSLLDASGVIRKRRASQGDMLGLLIDLGEQLVRGSAVLMGQLFKGEVGCDAMVPTVAEPNSATPPRPGRRSKRRGNP